MLLFRKSLTSSAISIIFKHSLIQLHILNPFHSLLATVYLNGREAFPFSLRWTNILISAERLQTSSWKRAPDNNIFWTYFLVCSFLILLKRENHCFSDVFRRMKENIGKKWMINILAHCALKFGTSACAQI